MDNTIGRLYSRKNGWSEGEKIKCFHSSLMNKLPNIDLSGKNGLFILNYLHKNNLASTYSELYSNCKIYSNWYFYYGEIIEISCNDST